VSHVPPIRQLPGDTEAERYVLAAAVQYGDAAHLVADRLTPDHFTQWRDVFQAVENLLERPAPIDPITVKAEFERIAFTAAAGAIVSGLVGFPVVLANLDYYFRKLEAARRRRTYVTGGTRLIQIGERGDLDIEDLEAQADAILDAVGVVPATSTARPVSELALPFLDLVEGGPVEGGLKTGFKDLDDLLGGLMPGQLVVIGARPGIGKSVLLLNIAMHVSVNLKRRVLFASLEMDSDEVMARLYSQKAKIPLQALTRRVLEDHHWGRLSQYAAELVRVDELVIDDNPHITLPYLRGQLSAMRRAGHPVSLLCLDYLQLVTTARRQESRQQEVSDLSRQLKLLAKEFGVPVLVVCQLNRGPEQRHDKRPTKADLRESGALEQDADIVILLHREDAANRETTRVGEADLIVDKNRQGPTGIVTVTFQGQYSRFADLARDVTPPSGAPDLRLVVQSDR
jgi:replicative DNA helicase